MSVRTRRPLEKAVATVLVLAILALAPTAIAGGHGEHWVGTWSNALHEPDLGVPGLNNPGFNDQTLRRSCTSASAAPECACGYRRSERVAW